MSGFAIIPEDSALLPVSASARDYREWEDDDVERAISAAQQAGLESYRVEIAPNGTISIIVGSSSDAG